MAGAMQRMFSVDQLAELPARNNLRAILGTGNLGQRAGLLLDDKLFRENRADQYIGGKLEPKIEIVFEYRYRHDDTLVRPIGIQHAPDRLDGFCNFKGGASLCSF